MMFSKKWVLARKKSEIIAGFRHLGTKKAGPPGFANTPANASRV
jgi:hypothetical protein